MATTISGTTLTFGNGSTQQAGGGKVISYGYGEYSTRTSFPDQNNYIYWDAATINRTRADSDIHVKSMQQGHQKYSYPFGGTFVEIKDPSGNKYRSYMGSHYEPCRENDQQEVIYQCDWTFRDSAISNATGNWTVHFGWQSINGTNNKWCRIWNPNNNDDGRGYQKSSVCFVEEIIWGD